MKLIKVASLEDKLKRAGNPTDPLLVQVCRLDDTKNLLNWNNIRARKGNENSLEKELENFFKSGRALKEVQSQLSRSKKNCDEALLFEKDKTRKFEISTQERKRITKYLEDFEDWEKCLFDKKSAQYKKSKAFLYIMIASNSISNRALKPSYELLQQIYSEFSKDTSQEQMQQISEDTELLSKLNNVGIDDLSGGMKGLTSDIQKALVIFRDNIDKKKTELEWLVGYDPTLYDSLPIDEDKEKYRGMDFDEVKEMIYKENSHIPEHAREKALVGILNSTKRYLWATPVEELGDEERAHFEELKGSLIGLKSKRDDLNPILEDILYSRSKGESQIAELCEAVQVQTEVDVEIETDFTKNIEDGWYCIPGGNGNTIKAVKHSGIDLRDRFPDTDWKKQGNRIQFISLVSAGTGWCINQLSFAKSYGDSDIILYVENGIGTVCIRYRGDKISEFTGFNNRPINLVPYADEIFSLCDRFPSIREAFKGFVPGKNHGSLEGIKKDIKGVEEHNGLTPLELAKKIEADIINPQFRWRVDHEEMTEWQRRTTSDYVHEDKVEECSSCPEFVAAMKKQWLKIENNEKSNLAGRFPFLKKDEEVISEAVEVLKQELSTIVDQGNDNNMRGVSLINMCNQFGQIPLKDPEVRELAFQAYSKMVAETNPDEKKKNILSHLRVIVKEAGAYSLFQDVASAEGVKAIAEGDLEKFAKIKKDFDLSSDMGELQESALEGLIDKAITLYLNDFIAFENLDELFDGRLTEPKTFKRIYDEAYKLGILKAVRWIEEFDEDYFQNKLRLLFEIFPGIDKEPEVVDTAIAISSSLIVDNNELFFALDNLFDDNLSNGPNGKKIKAEAKDYSIDKVVYLIDTLQNPFNEQIKSSKLHYLLKSSPDLTKEVRIINAVLRIADKLIIDNPEYFNYLDNLFDHEFTKGDYYESILKKAQPHLAKKAKTLLKSDDITSFLALVKSFPNIQHDLEVVKMVTSRVVDLLVNSNPKDAQALYKVMGYNSYDLDYIYDEVFDKVLNKAKKCMSQWDLEGLAKLDRMTGRKIQKNKETGGIEVVKPGKVLGEKRSVVIEGSKDMALTHILSKLLIWTRIKEEKDPIGKLITMDQVYGGTFLTNPKVKDLCRILYLKSKALKDESFFADIVKKIEGIYGNALVTDQDLQRYRKKQLRNIAIKSEQALDNEDFEMLKRNFSNFPELKEDNNLLRRSMQHIYNASLLVETDSFERIRAKKDHAEILNSYFEGQILSSKIGAEGYRKIKRAFEKANMDNLMANPQQTQSPQNNTNNTFNMKEHVDNSPEESA